MSGLYLYRAFGADGTTLYVGVAKNWATRWASHSARAPWIREVCRLELQWCPDPIAAVEAERHAIDTEAPIYNRRAGGGGIAGLGVRGLQCPMCGCWYAYQPTALWLNDEIQLDGPRIVGTTCGDQSGADAPCPGQLMPA